MYYPPTAGLEPATPGLEGQCAVHYATWVVYIIVYISLYYFKRILYKKITL